MHKTVDGTGYCRAAQGQWVSWLGFAFIPAYLEATLKPVQALSDMCIYIYIHTHSYIHICVCMYINMCQKHTRTNVITK